MLVMFCVALASASVAVTISWSVLFRFLREYLYGFAEVYEGIWRKIYELFSCAYCLGHWTSLFFYLLVRPIVVTTGWAPTDYLVNYFILVGITSFISTAQLSLLYLYKMLSTKSS